MSDKPKETAEERDARLKAHVAKVSAEQLSDADTELRAMGEVLRIMHPLPSDAQHRVMRWVDSRLDNFTPPIATFDSYTDEPPF